eukprot:3854056-Pyramimonas_sp.AAC.1
MRGRTLDEANHHVYGGQPQPITTSTLPTQQPDASAARAYRWLSVVELQSCTVRWRRADIPLRPCSRTVVGSAMRDRYFLG